MAPIRQPATGMCFCSNLLNCTSWPWSAESCWREQEISGVSDGTQSLPQVSLLPFFPSPGFYSANHWCGRPHPPLSQLHPAERRRENSLWIRSQRARLDRRSVWEEKGSSCTDVWTDDADLVAGRCAGAGAETALLPHALYAPNAIGNHGQVYSARPWRARLLMTLPEREKCQC